MLMFTDATLTTDKATSELYEYALGEDDPIEFPLTGATVTHFGSRISITIPDPRPGRPAVVLDRLVRAGEPTLQTKGKKETWSFSGSSERLHMQGIAAEDGIVSFTITKHGKTAGSVDE